MLYLGERGLYGGGMQVGLRPRAKFSVGFGAPRLNRMMPDGSDSSLPPADFIAHVTRAQRTLHAFILSIVRNAADADDVLQEANIVLWRKAAEYDATREFMPWAMRIAQWQALALLKKKSRARVTFDDDLLALIAEEAMAEAAETDPRRVALAGCLEKLPDGQRALIARRYEPGSSVNALAEERGISPKALSEMLRRTRQMLLNCIERTLAQEARA
ncbi:RNA polymerase sigma-70 factor (ECF subfamily) [Chthoniobacter flavus]|nr:RNA polymerase sigma-70 factor (ECF subfamily) [Chthoniobacter flavus]